MDPHPGASSGGNVDDAGAGTTPPRWSKVMRRLKATIAIQQVTGDIVKAKMFGTAKVGVYAAGGRSSAKLAWMDDSGRDADEAGRRRRQCLWTAWEVVVAVAIVYTVLVTPIVFAYVNDTVANAFTDAEYVIDAVFLVDFAMALGMRVVTPFVAALYVLCLFPFGPIATAVPDSMIALAQLLHLFRLFKYLRLHRASRILDERRLRRPPSYQRVTRASIIRGRLLWLLGLLCVLAHMMGSGFIFVARIAPRYHPSHPYTTWMTRYPFQDRASFIPVGLDEYLVAVYWFLTTLCTVGYGDVVAVSPIEQTFAIAIMLCSATSLAYVTAIFSSIVNERDSQKREFIEKMASLSVFVEAQQFPEQLRLEMFRYFHDWWRIQKASSRDGKDILLEMPPAMRYSATAFMFRQMIARAPILRTKPNSLVSDILMQMKVFKFNDGELMAQFGDATTDWMVVESGTVVLLSPNKKFQLMQFEAGTSIGELGIVLTGVWMGDVRAEGPVTVWSIPRPDLIKLIRSNTDMRQDFVTIARTRFGILQTALDRARVMEEKAQSLFLNAAKIGRRRMIKERPSEHARSTSADDAAEKATANADRYVKLSSEIIKRVGSAVVTLTDSSWLDAPVCAGTAVTVTVAPVEEQLFALRTKVDTEIANDIRHLRTLLECIATPEQIAQARERCSSQTRRASMPRAISTDDSEQPSRPEPRRLSRNLSR